MLKQSWSLGSTVPALCPKCNAEALHRSHAHSHLEEKRKQLSSKRPFRCHECGWRGWLEEGQLRYSAAVVKARVVSNHETDVEIPDFKLEDAERSEETRDSGRTMAADGTRHADEDTDLHEEEARSGVYDAEETVHAEEHGTGDAVRFEDMDGSEERRDEEQEIDKLPNFDEASGKPVTHKVDQAFHHHARHTSKKCPGCGEGALFRSRSRSFSENVKKKFTMKRLYRCHRCGWRGWLTKGF